MKLISFEILTSKIHSYYQRLVNYLSRNFYPKPNIETTIDEVLEVKTNGKPKTKILYIATKFDYANKDRGLSYEEHNMFHTLINMPDIEIIRFDFYSICQKYGQKYANEMIKEVALLKSVDQIFLILFIDIFDYSMLKNLSDNYSIKTILWLFDDDKRYLQTSTLARNVTKVVTTIKRRHILRTKDQINSHLSQFGVNHYLYKDYNMDKVYDVVFVGQKYEERENYINFIKNQGIQVLTFGGGWSSERVTQAQMIEIFNKAKIVLNFSSLEGNFGGHKIIKGRISEVMATGAFLLTEDCEELADYFNIGVELDFFRTREEMIKKIKFYLANEEKRKMIAHRGKIKVLKDYTYEKLFTKFLY